MFLVWVGVLFRVGLVLWLIMGIIFGFGLSSVFGCESLLRDLQIEPTLTLRTPGFQLLSAEPSCRTSRGQRPSFTHTRSIAHRKFLKALPTHIAELSSRYFPQARKLPHCPLRVHLFLQPRSSKWLSDRVTNRPGNTLTSEVVPSFLFSTPL